MQSVQYTCTTQVPFARCYGPLTKFVLVLAILLVLLLMAEILHQLVGSFSHYLQGFIHPWWCRISSISSSTTDTESTDYIYATTSITHHHHHHHQQQQHHHIGSFNWVGGGDQRGRAYQTEFAFMLQSF